jgi:hypothetical protein
MDERFKRTYSCGLSPILPVNGWCCELGAALRTSRAGEARFRDADSRRFEENGELAGKLTKARLELIEPLVLQILATPERLKFLIT